MKLYGTLTSPYVRRVRIVAALAEAPLELVDTSTEAGQTALRTVAPLWKVPTLDSGADTIFDSRVIQEWLLERYGNRGIRVPGDDAWRETNIRTVVDGALDSLINVFYLKKDGASPASLSYLQKQVDRAGTALRFIERQVEGGYVTGTKQVGLTEIAILTALDWMRFREAYPVERHEGLMRFMAAHAGDEVLTGTRPPGYAG